MSSQSGNDNQRIEFSIVIPCYNDWDRLEQCLKKLSDCEHEDFDYEIVVVDNAKEHNPPDKIRQFSNVVLIHEPTPGSYAARNSGVKVSRGNIIAFTDSDCLPDKLWLENAEELFRNKSCDMIGGRVDLFKVENGGEWAYIFEKHIAFKQQLNVPKGHTVTANMFIRKEVFNNLNGFNAAIKSGGDWEFSERAVANGYKMVYGENVAVRHPARTSVRKLFKKQRRFTAWGYLNVKRKFGHSELRIFASNVYHGIRQIFQIGKKIPDVKEKSVVVVISAAMYFYKIFLLSLILIRLINPAKIRE